MAIEKKFFRQVLGQFVTGVTVITTNSRKGVAGITVNAFCSVSLDPPLVLISVDLRSTVLPSIRESGVFVVNILTDQQKYLSRCFSTHSQERFDQFCHASYHFAVTGCPVLDGVLAFIDTRVVAEYPGGDHVIFLGRVEAMGIGSHVAFADETDGQSLGLHFPSESTTGEKAPLIYYCGQYHHLAFDHCMPSLTSSPGETAGRQEELPERKYPF